MKCNAPVRGGVVQRFSYRYIDFVKSPEGHVLRSNHKMCEAFQTHFCDRFSRCLDLPVQNFRSCLADFPRLQEAEAASCESLVTEYEVCDALKQVNLKKSPGLDDLPDEVFAPVLVALQRAWSRSWRKMAGMYGRVWISF